MFLAPALAAGQSAPNGSGFLGVRLDTAAGAVRVVAVLPGSPAERAGLHSGDQIIEVNHRPVARPAEVISSVSASRAGSTIPIVVSRSGSRQVVNATLGSAPAPGEIMQSYVGRPAPQIHLPRVDESGQLDLAGLRGRVVLVYFWSVWCGACRMATPALERWHRTLEQRGLTIVGIAGDPLPEVRRAAQEASLPFPLVHDADSKVSTSYWIDAVPSFFLIDRQGQVVLARAGWDSAASGAMEQEILRQLARSAP